MELRQLRSKRAQDTTAGSVMIWILVIVVVVVIILGVTGAFNYIFSKIGLLPDNTEATAQICGNLPASALNDYCTNFRDVKMGGENQKVTCKYLEGFAKFTHLDGVCDQTQIDAQAKSLCINGKLKSSMKLNGKMCSELLIGSACQFQSGKTAESCKLINDKTTCEANANICQVIPGAVLPAQICQARAADVDCNKLTLTECSNNPNICVYGSTKTCGGTSTYNCADVNNPSQVNCETLGCQYNSAVNPPVCSGSIDCSKVKDSCTAFGCQLI